jgi:hypothetical protein
MTTASLFVIHIDLRGCIGGSNLCSLYQDCSHWLFLSMDYTFWLTLYVFLYSFSLLYLRYLLYGFTFFATLLFHSLYRDHSVLPLFVQCVRFIQPCGRPMAYLHFYITFIYNDARIHNLQVYSHPFILLDFTYSHSTLLYISITYSWYRLELLN